VAIPSVFGDDPENCKDKKQYSKDQTPITIMCTSIVALQMVLKFFTFLTESNSPCQSFTVRSKGDQNRMFHALNQLNRIIF
jgi:hypothetical protein